MNNVWAAGTLSIPEVEKIILNYVETTKNNGYFNCKRAEQNDYWLTETINDQLKQDFFNHPQIQNVLAETKKAVQNNETSPFAAAQLLLETYKNLRT